MDTNEDEMAVQNPKGNSSSVSASLLDPKTKKDKRPYTKKAVKPTENPDSPNDYQDLKNTVKQLTKMVNILVKDKLDERNSQKEQRQEEILEETNGESATTPSNGTVAFSNGLPAGEQLPARIKEKIVSDCYVDFYDILYPENEFSYNLSLDNTDRTPTLNFLPRKKRSLSENEWCRAFDDYLSIYVQNHPQKLHDLISYGKSIKDMMSKAWNWNYYDSQFRKDREYSKCNWRTLRMDLQLTAAQHPKLTNIQGASFRFDRQNQATQSNKFQVPKGYCFNYHNPKQWCNTKDCSFKHLCPECNERHPIFKHHQRRNWRNGDNTRRDNKQPSIFKNITHSS